MNRKEWLARRRTGVGSSDAAVIALGKVFSRTLLDLFIEKFETKTEVVEIDTDDTRRGTVYEPLIGALIKQHIDVPLLVPIDDDDRYSARFSLVDPEAAHRLANADGWFEDGWVCEIKSPRQRSCDRMRAEGINDYYMIQGQHLAGVANKTGCPLWGPGACKGVRFCIFEPETAKIQIVEVPRDDAFIASLFAMEDRFWRQHVLAGKPPIDWAPPPPAIPKAKGEYQPMTGDAWAKAARGLQMARDMLKAAERRYEDVKADIVAAMEAAGADKILLPGGLKVSNALTAGRTTTDLKALAAEHPEIDLKRYARTGEPFRSFRLYAKGEAPGASDDALDVALGDLRGELDALPTRDVDIETATILFDNLRARTECYTAALTLELEHLNGALARAQDAIAKRTK